MTKKELQDALSAEMHEGNVLFEFIEQQGLADVYAEFSRPYFRKKNPKELV